jgi:hypothetical protein
MDLDCGSCCIYTVPYYFTGWEGNMGAPCTDRVIGGAMEYPAFSVSHDEALQWFFFFDLGNIVSFGE